ncbi:MAG TPA: AAA family ATPase, partial [Gaiellaceae bacterium]
MVTIVGEAGVGKSRLVAEALATIDARVVQGRCLPYGDGITYWPVVEVVKELGTLPSNPAVAAALRALLGESEGTTTTEEIARAFRKLLEEQAPLVAVFDDLQWGEETFHDLVESIALLASEAPILLLCLARPELLTRRSEWPVALRLEPLRDEDVAELIGDRVPETVRDRIAHAAGGNPLFVTEMLAMASGSAEVDVPLTLRALLAARLDQLDPPDRRLLERAAIEGETFHRGAVQALAPDEPQVTHRLASLTRRELIRPDKAQIAGEDAFRFRHLLIRDAAYDGIPKAVRADLHERYADWLAERGSGLVELDQLLGYHLEQACRYRRELGRPVAPALAARARGHLTAAGRRAYRRRDEDAAASLFSRAAALLEPDELDLALELDLGNSLFRSGAAQSAVERNVAATKQAAARGDHLSELALCVQGGTLDVFLATEGAVGRLEELVSQAVPKFKATGHHVALAEANLGAWLVATVRGLHDDAAAAADHALENARLAGLPHYDAHLLPAAARGRWYGSTPIPELLHWLDAQEQAGSTNHILRLTRV